MNAWYGSCLVSSRDGERMIHFQPELGCSLTLGEDDARVMEHLVHRVRAEFLEMPGLRLTVPQAQRFWGLEEEWCAAILSHLVEARFLRRTDDGLFARHDAGTA